MEVPLFSPPNPYSFHRTYLHLPESPSIYIHLFLALYFTRVHLFISGAILRIGFWPDPTLGLFTAIKKLLTTRE